MTQATLTIGSYAARSVLANAQHCINLYIEKNPPDSPFPTTHYPTPGLRVQFVTPDGGPIRYIFQDSHENVYVVSGPYVYAAKFNGVSTWNLTQIGKMNTINGPVRATDNGTDIIFCDGTTDGWDLTIASQSWKQITDDAWYGSQAAATMDTFMIFAWPGNGEFYTTLSNSVTFDATYFAAKSGAPDLIQALAVVHRQLWLFGSETSELWWDAGGSTFPFARIPGVFVQQGIAAIWSLATANENVFWLGQGEQGKAMAYMGTPDGSAMPIANPAIVDEWQTYSSINDATGFTYQMGTHIFYVLTFPSMDKTWVYDMKEGEWHEWNWMDGNGNLHRSRVNAYCFAKGLHLAGDWETGNVYSLDPNVYTDNGDAIFHARSFPHTIDTEENVRLTFKRFIAAMEVGYGPGDTQAGVVPPKINLRYSDDGGLTWGNKRMRDLGAMGKYKRNLLWTRLGMGRDRVWELSWAASVKTSLNGAFFIYSKNRT